MRWSSASHATHPFMPTVGASNERNGKVAVRPSRSQKSHSEAIAYKAVDGGLGVEDVGREGVGTERKMVPEGTKAAPSVLSVMPPFSEADARSWCMPLVTGA